MRDQPAGALQELPVFLAKRVHLVAFRVDHAYDLSLIVRHWNNDLRARGVECRQIAQVLGYVTNDDGFARFEHRAAEALPQWEPRIGRRLIAGTRKNDEILVYDFVDADPAIVARCPN